MPRVVLVTGCSTGGIGYALCEEFALQGCKVYATSRNISKIADFSNENIEKLALDVNSDESITQVVKHILEADGKIDVVVNNAGVTSPGPLVEVPIEQVKEVFETNTFAILRVCKAVVPVMAKRGSGTIVNIGSIVGEISTPWSGIYCASKAAVNTLSEVLSMELQPLNISVLHVAPGAVQSNIANNGASRFSLEPGSLYTDYMSDILRRISSSQGPNSMPSQVFARKVVGNALRKSPPRYMTLGGNATLFKVFKWLPRSIVLYLLWKAYSKRG
ncbi:Short-chain dehydrogenase cctT [Psilocybe cubensis]|uniref:Short-chain dehydrogenase cctT n=2 Tax=Psilocybe cubensis TaxID=181762 RepID=A0ACB8HF61_PSICU|nr:Short-chain dehydrogenase cctT [Psilocybe cubensis]KAH9486548.1 Short-chain dehydrogenase cctT [Psilocybe cubensis]